MKRIVIVGATSGIGLEVARLCIRAGWRVGAAGRRKEALEALRSEAPGQVETETIDITRDDAPEWTITSRSLERLRRYARCLLLNSIVFPYPFY